jgi:hypothetical protein
MRAQGKSRKWIIIVVIILIIVGIWYYTGGDLSILTDKIKSIIPAAGE